MDRIEGAAKEESALSVDGTGFELIVMCHDEFYRFFDEPVLPITLVVREGIGLYA